MNYVLLLGAGFSKNWGGWLAAEAFEYLLGYPAIRDNALLRERLWKHQPSGGFEAALAEVQDAHRLDPASHKMELDALQTGVSKMFDDMNRVFLEERIRLEFQSRIELTVGVFLSRFDAIFTLNQDLLLEHRYLTRNPETGPHYRNWKLHDLPGLRLAPGSKDHGYKKMVTK